ncbi:MAG TPA: hypothetical protein VF897_23410 [Roseiflexaceae bacterium]
MRRLSRILLAALALVLAACGAGATGGAAPTQLSSPTTAQGTPTQPTPTAAPMSGETGPTGVGTASDVVVTYRKSGGIAGINETLTIYADGRLDLKSLNREAKTAQVAPSELSRLRQLLASPEFAALKPSYEAPGADQFIYALSMPGGQKITTTDGAETPAVLEQAIAELERLKRQVR